MTAEAGIEGLVARVDRGDRAALAALYALTAPRLFALCQRIAGNRPAAEAALARVYRTLWHDPAEREAMGLAPMTWLVLRTRHEALAARRAAAPQDDTAQGVAAPRPGRTGQAAPELADLSHPDVAEGSALLADLARDDPDRAEALGLIWLDGADQAALAARYGRPVHGIRPWLRAGLARLDTRLDARPTP